MLTLLSKQLKVGYYCPTGETPFEWCFTSGTILAQECMLSGIYFYGTDNSFRSKADIYIYFHVFPEYV